MRSRPGSLLLIAAALTASGCGDDGPGRSRADELRPAIEARMEEAASAGFTGTLLVTVSGAISLGRGYGLANRETGVPNQLDTAFDFGSVMKDLTAAAIFRLEEAGALEITDTLATLFEDVPADKADITLLEILQHRAGFQPYHDTAGDFEPMTRLEARERIFAQELLFAPGSDQAYSNAGFTLLADIVETVSERAFTDYVREELMRPAGMEQSGFFGEELWQEIDTAVGYGASTFQDNDPATWPSTWALVGNGGLVMTTTDLERWLVAVWSGEVLGPGAFDAYESQYLEPGELEGHVAYGYAGGGDYGLGGVAVDLPELGSRVIIGSNTYTEAVDELAIELATLVASDG
jgi:CubicO group peptidase (beta-lactamase class C family)